MPIADKPPRPEVLLAEPARYALVFLLPPDIAGDLAERMRSIPGMSIPLVGYHVTVYGPFAFRGDRQRGREMLRRILRGVRPFTVDLRRIGYFRQPDDNAVILHVDSSPALLRLHARLVAALGDLTLSRHPRGEQWDRRDYTPHVSLGLHLTDATLDASLRLLRDHDLAYRFQARRVSLFEARPPAPWVWSFCESYELRGKRARGTIESRTLPPALAT